MSDFNIAYKETGKIEGGLANDKKDKGGFTYAGIASKFWPNWRGWSIIKEAWERHKHDIEATDKELASNKELWVLIKGFYQANFFNTLNISGIKDQQIANAVYDFGVNSGTHTSGDKLQDAYNTLFPNNKLVNDGAIGNKSLAAINSVSPPLFLKQFNIERDKYYRSLSDFKTFGKSWLSRIKPYNINYHA